MRFPRPRLSLRTLLIVVAVAAAPLALLRPIGPDEAIRLALPVVQKEYPGLPFDAASASATWSDVGGGHWSIRFEDDYWEVSVQVDPDRTVRGWIWSPADREGRRP
jgi:hypothetical protein